MRELEKIEIIREENGSVSLIVNNEKVEMSNTIGIHLDINCQDDVAYLELTRVERVAMLNFGKPLDVPRNNG